jgi:hypothetical protein
LMTRYQLPNRKWIALLAIVASGFAFGGCSSGSSSQAPTAYPKAMAAADEASAIQTLRTIANAQLQLKATRGVYGSFDALTQAGVLDERFAGSTPNLRGYRFTMNASDADFSVNADPQTTETQPTTGSRHFYLDSNDTAIHVSGKQTASRNDPTL